MVFFQTRKKTGGRYRTHDITEVSQGPVAVWLLSMPLVAMARSRARAAKVRVTRAPRKMGQIINSGVQVG